MEKTEFKVDEVFQYGLIKLKCVKDKEGKACFGKCFFGENGECRSVRGVVGLCSSDGREDKTNVIFVKVEE